jgi:hypothetical protein
VWVFSLALYTGVHPALAVLPLRLIALCGWQGELFHPPLLVPGGNELTGDIRLMHCRLCRLFRGIILLTGK